jgi:heterodisulfide reductase subunit C
VNGPKLLLHAGKDSQALTASFSRCASCTTCCATCPGTSS